MEPTHGMLLNEDVCNTLNGQHRARFVFEWLRCLKKLLPAADKVDVKQNQKRLVEQLMSVLTSSPGHPTRYLLAYCVALVYRGGESLSSSLTVEQCHDIIRSKDDSPSFLPTRLAAVACLGAMYQQLGRFLISSFRETVATLLKALKSSESQGRYEIMQCIEKILKGLGVSAVPCHRDIYKATRSCLTDRSMAVRCVAAKCLLELQREAVFLWSTELENMASLCFRAFDDSNDDVCVIVSKLLGTLLASALGPMQAVAPRPGVKRRCLEELTQLLFSGFLQHGAGFLRVSGDMLKGITSVNENLRVGITQACVVFISTLGGAWLEAHFSNLLYLLMTLVCDARVSQNLAEAVYCRRCVSYILRATVGTLLGEKAQRAVAKELCLFISSQIKAVDAEEGNARSSVLAASPHMLLCVLLELGSVFQDLGSSAAPLLQDSSTGILDTVISMLLHPSLSARLAAAWCLRCIAIALPAQMVPLLDWCSERLNDLRPCPEAVAGYTAAIAALLGAVQHCPLGIPHFKGKSVKELEGELRRGDLFTWQVALESRAGALFAMKNLVINCKDILSDNVIGQLLPLLSCAVGLLTLLPSLKKSYGKRISNAVCVFQMRMYEVLALLPPKTYEGCIGTVLNQLVKDLTDPENTACAEVSLLRPLCHALDLSLLGPALHEMDQHYIEKQLHEGKLGRGTLEYDHFTICEGSQEEPAPFPPAEALIINSVQLFGVFFLYLDVDQRVQILEQFCDCMRQLKGNQQKMVQINVTAAFCSSLKCLALGHESLGPEEVQKPALSLLLGALESSNTLLRCVAAEGLARFAQVLNDKNITASLGLMIFDKLKEARDAILRNGYALLLGALCRYQRGIYSPKHLSACVELLFTLSQDSSSPEVQKCSLRSLTAMVDQAGPLYLSHMEASLTLVLHLLFTTPQTHVEVQRSLGCFLSVLITSLGPDLQGKGVGVCAVRNSCLLACEIMQDNPDCLVQAQAIACFQQLHMFSPCHVDLASLIPSLCMNLYSTCLYLSRTVVSCLLQFAQREALEVSEGAVVLVKKLPQRDKTEMDVTIKEVGLEGALFSVLDNARDVRLCQEIKELLIHLMSSAVESHLTHWLKLCSDVISSTCSDSVVAASAEINPEEDADSYDDASFFHTKHVDGGPFNNLRWSSRVFAVRCVCHIIVQCAKRHPAHFDMKLAQEERLHKSTDFLILHLADLVRMAFMAATDYSEQLRLAGLHMLLLIIHKFAGVPEVEFPGHGILEQYQANVGAALRPAFSADAPPDVTAKACQVCSAWMCSGVVSDLHDLRRVYQLLAFLLVKVQAGREVPNPLYNESILTMESLAVLKKALAEVYIMAVRKSSQREQSDPAVLLKLVQGELSTLSCLWLAALQDHALLTLPPDYSTQLPSTGGTFYTAETLEQARQHYRNAWAPMLHATALWLNSNDFVMVDEGPANFSRPVTPTTMGHSTAQASPKSQEDICVEHFYLILGISVEFLCLPHSQNQTENIISCLYALQALLEVPWPRSKVGTDQALSVELLNVLHRLMVTRESPHIQLAVLELVQQVVLDDGAAEKETVPEFGEGQDTGGLVPGKSLVFGVLQLCLCALLRKLPQLSPRLAGSPRGPGGIAASLSDCDCRQITLALQVLSELPSICSPAGSVSVLPTVLYLLLGVLRELVREYREVGTERLVPGTLQALQTVLSSPMGRVEKSHNAWVHLLRSALTTLLMCWNTDTSHAGVDEITLLTALTIFLLDSNVEVTNVEPLKTGCISKFQAGLKSNDPLVLSQCYQLLAKIFQGPTAVAESFIRGLGPQLVAQLQQVEKNRPQTAVELQAVQDGVRAMEALVLAAQETQRPNLVAMMFPILVSFLLDKNTVATAPEASCSLHDFALQALMRLGSQHPAVIKAFMTSAPHMKARLQAAIKGNREHVNSKVTPTWESDKRQGLSIKLKTNFL
ncbi:HEAT repeat-containing protein 5A [Bagarius yarrelli]|uniref:HEAT repeat-containing protein 5A n=1 Tax=Bagarius yarrelli TaxID=175774 RepID=A0A556V6B0_BAGYA|nr:HEAT repeat-containing protein 5A [Bagarius yarrelli]